MLAEIGGVHTRLGIAPLEPLRAEGLTRSSDTDAGARLRL